MNYGKIFAFIIAGLDFLAGIGYAYTSDWKHSIAWFCWSIATVMVTIW